MNRQQQDILGFAGWCAVLGFLFGWEGQKWNRSRKARQRTRAMESLVWTPRREEEMKAHFADRFSKKFAHLVEEADREDLATQIREAMDRGSVRQVKVNWDE